MLASVAHIFFVEICLSFITYITIAFLNGRTWKHVINGILFFVSSHQLPIYVYKNEFHFSLYTCYFTQLGNKFTIKWQWLKTSSQIIFSTLTRVFNILIQWSNPNLFRFWGQNAAVLLLVFLEHLTVQQIQSSVLSVTMVKLTGPFQDIQVQLSWNHRLSGPFLNFWRGKIHCFMRSLIFLCAQRCYWYTTLGKFKVYIVMI